MVHHDDELGRLTEGSGALLQKTAAELKVSVCPLINPDTLPLIDKMCEWYPDTSVVVDHLARLGMADPPKAEEVRQLLRLARHAKTHVKASAFYALGAKKAPYTDLGPMIRHNPGLAGFVLDRDFEHGGRAHRQAIALQAVPRVRPESRGGAPVRDDRGTDSGRGDRGQPRNAGHPADRPRSDQRLHPPDAAELGHELLRRRRQPHE